MEFEIRQAKFDDIKQIIDIENLCFEEEDRFDSFLFYLFVRRRNKEIFLVAEVNEEIENRIAGFIIAILNSDGHYEIATINVHPDKRRMGVGEKLMIAMENDVVNLFSESLNLRIIDDFKEVCLELTVFEKNHAAIHLYNKLNYQEVRRIPNYYRKDRNGIRMIKKVKISL